MFHAVFFSPARTRAFATGGARRKSPKSPPMMLRFVLRFARTLAAVALALSGIASIHAPAIAADDAVNAVGDGTLTIVTPAGRGVQHYFGTASLDGDANATRALIVLHGVLRNGNDYERSAENAVDAAGSAAAGTIVIAPQFLNTGDVRKYRLPGSTIRWRGNHWSGGDDSVSPVRVSTFAVLDAIVERLADRARFPKMREIVVAGHSAGGQLVQRYAVTARSPEAIAGTAVRVRFIVANPSSYLYFDATRPRSRAACPGFNDWRYGFDGHPRYVSDSPASYEARYVQRNVTYLLGGADTDPHEESIDTSCEAETQGLFRLARGENYVTYIRSRHPGGTAQTAAIVPGVGHDHDGMFLSACGLAVLFGRPRTACGLFL
jgi:pimeloyl-ACP methyl ester carboxylesterase